MSEQLTVCVTGASGFIASHIVQQLLEQGHKVRGTVRGAASKYDYLTSLPNAKENLELIQADLLTEGSFDQAVKGCDYVMHTASPYIVNVKNPQTDLVDPAVQGTTNVLRSCKKNPEIKRVILTSSVAAITDEPNSDHVFSEKDWNNKSNLKRNPYYYSKTLAEQAAWDFIEKEKTAFDLVVINPYMVLGPSLGPGLNETNKIFKDMLSGVYPTIMSVNWGMVDVRDVAKSHILAMQNDAASGRYLVANESLKMSEVVEYLNQAGYNKYKLPKVNMATPFGDKVMKLLSYTQPKGSGSYMRTHIGKVMRYDNSKVKNELGIDFIPARESMSAAVNDLIKWQHVPAKV